MKIICLIRNTNGLKVPDTFILGQKPLTMNVEDAVSPKVSDIKFFETSTVYAKAYRGRTGIYIIEFEGSTVKRIVPERTVIDIAVETAEKQAPGAKESKLPDLSGE